MCRRRTPATPSAACTTAWRNSRRRSTSTSTWRTTSSSRGRPAWSGSLQRGDEPHNGRERLVAPVAMGSMAAVREDQRFDRSLDLALDRLDLPDRPILVLLALDDQHGTGDGRQELFDRPGRELRPQPDIRPAVEDPLGV